MTKKSYSIRLELGAINDYTMIHPRTLDRIISLETLETKKFDVIVYPLGMFNCICMPANQEQIQQKVKETGTHAFMTPEYDMLWEGTRGVLKKHGFEIIDDHYNDNARVDYVGMWFSPDEAYAFPNNPEIHVHKIPHTPYGVSIGENIEKITREELKGVEVILNPSHDEKDKFLWGKTKIMELKRKRELTRGRIKSIADSYYPKGTNFLFKKDKPVESIDKRINEALREEGVAAVVRLNKDFRSSGVLYLSEEWGLRRFQSAFRNNCFGLEILIT